MALVSIFHFRLFNISYFIVCQPPLFAADDSVTPNSRGDRSIAWDSASDVGESI